MVRLPSADCQMLAETVWSPCKEIIIVYVFVVVVVIVNVDGDIDVVVVVIIIICPHYLST